ncbi:N-acetyl-gamma-glutamyl-phosphate reductase [Thiomicrorhabdus xiamenensis]|uniref:N-acetyl-gamma-glutamyl-phosphate reductase n=1 Tax=Thiomicrorhabdus xiamenensis TaxID=2739063 RepID=A0A7D4NKK4_9GAMM|nr:N-acetyl-gamma-glutamyl-phosphate reductase [Thiomicrorhabdus xiamenensis]QKI88474.1 N-acetyl-gamma-glutamyl-phosphate reductase [Thiomicrorhabdus xiamenensis]
MQKVKVGIVGGTGYTGVELLRLLANHPQAEVSMITSRSEEGVAVADMYPNLRGIYDLQFTQPDSEKLKSCDIVFFATPHGVAMSMADDLTSAGVKVIDLAADFRIEDLDVWSKWYGMPHTEAKLFDKVCYGLPEYFRDNIAKAMIIANPGCYPTSVLLGLLPLLKAGVIDPSNIIADGKSGVSGAGRGANVAMLGAEMSESFKAYGVSGHRHLPEMKEKLTQLSGGEVGLTFVPHLVPMVRGMENSIYATMKTDMSQAELQQLFEETYKNEPFVDVMPAGSLPETRMVKGSNMCRLAVYRPQGSSQVVVTSVIDNLVKGAAGQAVQNMNILFGLEETLGLTQVALLP